MSYSRIYRLLSMLLDHFILSALLIPPILLVQFVFFKGEFKYGSFFFYLIMFIYYNKDTFKGKSPAKRILGYQVVDYKTHFPATQWQCALRNITVILWPLEVLVSLFSPKRRIGDILACTKVIKTEKEPVKGILDDIKQFKLTRDFITVFPIGGIGILFHMFLFGLFSSWLNYI